MNNNSSYEGDLTKENLKKANEIRGADNCVWRLFREDFEKAELPTDIDRIVKENIQINFEKN